VTVVAENRERPLGFGRRHRFLILRRISQFGVLLLFLLGPWAGLWIIKGNLNASLALGVLPLADPFVLVQSWLAGLQFGSQAVLGSLIVAVVYFLAGGRAFCAWICPINVVTDAAHWLRTRLGLRGTTRIRRNTRYGLLAVVMLLAAVTGLAAWEWVNPVSVLHRGILFGMGAGWVLIAAVFLFDLVVSQRGWCGHLCPMGAFYSLIGRYSPLRIRADRREACDNCMDCFAVCPEPQVIRPALYGAKEGVGPVIDEANCTNCGRCIDVCPKRVFRFGSRFNGHNPAISHQPDSFEQEEART
jgi:ferredoxin-type protein NapH